MAICLRTSAGAVLSLALLQSMILLSSGKTFYDLNVFDIDGQPLSLSRYYGTVSLVVNVASACGLTKPNYEEMVEVQTKYGAKGFQILAFPCNQFNKQEPASNRDVKAFAVGNWSAAFPLFAKSTVNAPMCPDGRPEGLALCMPASSECCAPNNRVYEHLKAAFPGDIDWNFAKFLISKEGIPIQRWPSTTYPRSLIPDIEAALSKSLDFTAQ